MAPMRFLPFLLVLFLMPQIANAVIFIAHRGSYYRPGVNEVSPWPGNTIPAFESALQQGFQGFELDIYVSKDGHFVVAHDDELNLSSECQGKIRDLHWSEIQNCV